MLRWMLIALLIGTSISAAKAEPMQVWLSYSAQDMDAYSLRVEQGFRAELSKMPRLKLESADSLQNAVPIRIELATISDGRAAPPLISGVFYAGLITLQDPRTGEYVSWDALIGFSGSEPDDLVRRLTQWVDEKTEPAARVIAHWAEKACGSSSKPAIVADRL